MVQHSPAHRPTPRLRSVSVPGQRGVVRHDPDATLRSDCRGLVLDIETGPDAQMLEVCGRSARDAGGRVWLHGLRAFALLRFSGGVDGNLVLTALDSALVAPAARDDRPRRSMWQHASGGEGWDGFCTCTTALERIDEALADLGEQGQLITFNGRRHDVAFLRLQRRRLELFGPVALDHFAGREARQHIDMMEALSADGLRWPSLVDACAALAIPHAPHADPASAVPAPIRKCESDVLATFLLYVHEAAAAAGDARVLSKGWEAVARWCARAPLHAHRVVFAEAAVLRAAGRGERFP